jgi:chromosome segregation ATPase
VPTTCLVSEIYLSLVRGQEDHPEASPRIRQSTQRLRSLRAQLELVPPVLAELERNAASAAAELARAQAQASVDREAVVRLEAALAEREELRSSVRERLSELGRMLGSA